jgi:BASS family bile acid:Na+ symporter
MFGIGLTLRPLDFKNILVFPRAFFTALFSQMVALPLIAFAIASFAPIAAEFKIGLVILAASPGGATAGFITYFLKGDVALSVSLTSVNSFLTLFSIPVVVNIALQTYLGQTTDIQLPVMDTIIHIFFITIIPALLGITFRHYREATALYIERGLKFILILMLLAVFIVKFFLGKNSGGVDFIPTDFMDIIPYALLLNFCCLLFGYMFLRVFGLKHQSRITASIESGVHNTSLAILIAGTIIGKQEMVKPILLYAMFSFWTSLAFGFVANLVYERYSSVAKPG